MVRGSRLLMSEGVGERVDTQSTVRLNSNGYPSVMSNTGEYMMCN